jgi:hypothetical protein
VHGAVVIDEQQVPWARTALPADLMNINMVTCRTVASR